MAYICKAQLIGGQAGKIVLEVRDDSTGARNGDVGYVEINVADLMGQAVKARWTEGCDEGGSPVYALVLRGSWLTSLPEGATVE
jgi:hypothetical protein